MTWPAMIRSPAALASRGVAVEAILQHAGIAQHAGEQIIEIVGDAAGQHAEALEPLVVLDVRFQGFAFADIGGHHHDAVKAAVLGKGRRCPDMKVEGLPIRLRKPAPRRHGLAAAGAFGERAALQRCPPRRMASAAAFDLRTLPSRSKAVMASGQPSTRLASMALVCSSSFCARCAVGAPRQPDADWRRGARGCATARGDRGHRAKRAGRPRPCGEANRC